MNSGFTKAEYAFRLSHKNHFAEVVHRVGECRTRASSAILYSVNPYHTDQICFSGYIEAS